MRDLKFAIPLVLSVAMLFSARALAADADECDIPNQPSVVFLPKTSAPKNLLPTPEPGADLPRDCEFYRWAWQAFLFVTQPQSNYPPGNHKPAFLGFKTFQDVFKIKASPLFAEQAGDMLSLAPRNIQSPHTAVFNAGEAPAIGDVRQATVNAVLIDQDGNPIFYALHMNPSFVSFVDDYALNTLDGLKAAPDTLEFRPGAVELKSAWKIIDDPDHWKNYFTTEAVVPVFKNQNGKIVPDGTKTRPVQVALIALHVVGVIEGHPEFIWSTFEHVEHQAKDWVRDNAPAATENPDQPPAKLQIAATKYQLYPKVESPPPPPPVPNANRIVTDQELRLDEATQKFAPATPIYRMYPSSQASTSEPGSPAKLSTPSEDPEILSLNKNMRALFEKDENKSDVRGNYQLVGAVWFNTPRGSVKLSLPADFVEGKPFMNTARGAKPSVFGGEDRLSSTAMESFTQDENDPNGNGFPNCFSCHDTQGVGGAKGLKASRLNVSHMLSRFFQLSQH